MIRHLVVASCACAALGVSPVLAAAQQRVFVEALSEFTDAVAGTYGDEGPQLEAALQKMAAAGFRGPIELVPAGADTPLLPLAAYAAGYAHLARGEYDDAIAEFQKATARDPLVTDPAARSEVMRLAAAALRRGAAAEAHALLERSALPPDSSEAHRMLGLAYWADSRDDKSVEHLQRAVRSNPQDERSRLVLSRVLSSAGRDAEAERVLLDTIAAIPDSVQARWWLGWGYARLNRFADAGREFERAAAGAVAGRAPIYAAIGRLATQATDVTGAVAAFARAVDASPHDPAMRKSLAGALLRQDRADEALGELTAALRIDPLDAGTHAGIGQIHLDAGRYDEAVNALSRAIELSPAHTEARYALATALMRLGKSQEAEQEFERVEQAQRRILADRRRTMSLDVLKEEAALRAAEGSLDRAIALYEKAVALEADPIVYRQLAALYSRVGRSLDAARARAMYENALKQNSPGPAR